MNILYLFVELIGIRLFAIRLNILLLPVDIHNLITVEKIIDYADELKNQPLNNNLHIKNIYR